MDRIIEPSGRRSRRNFLASATRVGLAVAGLELLASCERLPLPTQSAKVPRIGYLSLNTEIPERTEAFREGLHTLGYVEGQNIAIEYRFAEGSVDPLPGFAAELVQLPVDVIVAAGTPAILAAKRASTTIPVVIAVSGNPVETGLVASLARPGGNITGSSTFSAGVSAKRLEYLKVTSPATSRAAVLWNPSVPDKVHDVRETEVAGQALGVQVQGHGVQGRNELGSAFEAIRNERADAVITLLDSWTDPYDHGAQLVDFATKNRLPSMCEGRLFPVLGGLMSYGPSITELYRGAATYVDKILKGAKPAELPVEQPTKLEFVINLQTAQALGLTIPQSVLEQATEVIQ